MQRGIRNACVAGIIDGEAETMDLTRQAYSTTSTITGVPVDALSLDTALLSNQATLHVTTGETVQELLAASGPTTMTDDTVNQCFADTFPDPDPVPVDSSMTSATETAVSETVEDSSSLLSSEAKQMSSEEQMMSSEVRMASSEGSLMCEALGTAATGLGAYFAVSGAIDQHEQGDDVGAALSLSTMIAPEVTVPLNGTYQGIKAGAEIMDMKVNCVALCEGYLETLGYVPADDKRAWECASPLLMPPPECIPDPMGP